LREQREPTLDLIQPGSVSRREVQMITRPLLQPASHPRRLTMPWVALADDTARGNVECGKQ